MIRKSMETRYEAITSMMEAIFLLVEVMYLRLLQAKEVNHGQITDQVLCLLRNLADINESFESNYVIYLRLMKYWGESDGGYHSFFIDNTCLQKNQENLIRLKNLIRKWPFNEELEREQAMIFLQNLSKCNKWR